MMHVTQESTLYSMQYQRTTLSNGLRLLTAPMDGMRSASIALIFTVGSRYETLSHAGISHFIEHMVFKGSQHYPTARHISETIEGVGGVFNGSTDKELTIYSARVPGEHLPTVMEVLADMVRRPLFDPQELEKERGVIIEELRSTRDDPQGRGSLLIDETVWLGISTRLRLSSSRSDSLVIGKPDRAKIGWRASHHSMQYPSRSSRKTQN